MSRRMDMTNKIFGRLTVLKYHSKTNSGKLKWLCICECGNKKVIFATALRMGDTKSCGCFQKQQSAELAFKHGKKKSRVYSVWSGMKQRCSNSKLKMYKNYGGRGIKLCKRWVNFENFYADMGDPPHGLSLDRINNDGDYEPLNCRWATSREQANNTRANRMIEFYGSKFTLAQWARILDMSARTLHARLNDYNWSIRKALTTPLRIT